MQDTSREKSKKTRKTFQTQNFLKFFLQKTQKMKKTLDKPSKT